MNELTDLYGLDERGVIERLAREEVAAEQFAAIRALELEAYAGAWFDSDTQRLHVAVADESSFAAVTSLGALPVLVERSLSHLEQISSDVQTTVAASPELRGAVLSRSINYRDNRIELQVLSNDAEALHNTLRQSGQTDSSVRVVGSDAVPMLSADVRGADGTRNDTWAGIYGGSWPCSIGVSITGGYVTAGHCGYPGNSMKTPGGVLLGTVQASQWTSGGDGGWVSTASGWTPSPKINGYADGIFNVAAKWSGLQVSPVGSTVCRYGQTSGGPDCGTVQALDELVQFFIGFQGGLPQYISVNGLTRASGICTDDGDSGGPYLAPSNQVQGTNTGGQPTNTCPTPASKVWFQPIGDTLSAYSKVMLTAHGAVKAVANGHACPDFANSGSGTFYCKIDSYNSQGETILNWTSNAASATSATFISGNCVIGSWVTVNLELINPYGTRNISSGFTCPTGLIQ